MSDIFWKCVTDELGSKYWILYKQGHFGTPIAIFEHYRMKVLAMDIMHNVHTDDLPMAIKRYRERHEYSQEDAAARIGISRNYLSQIERGLVDNLTMKMYEKIVWAIGDDGS